MTEETEALRLAELMDAMDYGDTRQAADELRRLSAVEAENETLKKTVEALAQAVARLQQHHATAWNRGHMMGMKANEDTARRALDAVKQDAWGNTMLTEALLKAEAQRDALLEAAREGLSVCRSVSIRHDRRITRDGCLLYAQTEEWCRWAEAEVGPKIDAAIKAVEENT